MCATRGRARHALELLLVIAVAALLELSLFSPADFRPEPRALEASPAALVTPLPAPSAAPCTRRLPRLAVVDPAFVAAHRVDGGEPAGRTPGCAKNDPQDR